MIETSILGRSAKISRDGKYRYHLRRILPDGGGIATFLMLNPSTANHEVDDPTIRRCLGYCRRWGCGTLDVVNLFALRATHPTALRKARDPVGPRNRRWVTWAVDGARRPLDRDEPGPVVCAWGTHGSYLDQDLAVLDWIEGLCAPMALGFTRDGHPRHPLYVPCTAELVPFVRRPPRP
jgi:hypothetical protein